MNLTKYLKTCIKLFLNYFLYFIFTPLTFVIIFLRPIVHFKFGTIQSSKFGGFVGSIINYSILKRHEFKRQTFDIIGYEKLIINKQLKKMFDRNYKTFSFGYIIRIIEKLLKFWTRGNSYSARVSKAQVKSKDLESLILDNPIKFTKDELIYGDLLIKKLNIPSDCQFICIHNRDELHLNQTHPGRDWSYHDYRNYSIKSLELAAEQFAKSNYYVVRVGSQAKEKLITRNPKIIDYTHSGIRSDFLDIYLAFKSKAYFGSESGIADSFKIFGKPTYCVNSSLTLLHSLVIGYSGLFTLKHLFNTKKQRKICLREMFELGLRGIARTEKFEQSGVKFISNSNEEVKEFAKDSLYHIEGQNVFSAEDEQLQKKFWDIYFEYEKKLKVNQLNLQISPSFLRRNKYLLS